MIDLETITVITLIVVFLVRIAWVQHKVHAWKHKYEPAFMAYHEAWTKYRDECIRKAQTLEEELDCDPAELPALRQDFLRKQSIWLDLWRNH